MGFNAANSTANIAPRTVVAVLLMFALIVAAVPQVPATAQPQATPQPQPPPFLSSPLPSTSPQPGVLQTAFPLASSTPFRAPGVGATPQPISTPTPSAEDFPRINRGATPIPTQTPTAALAPNATPATPSPSPLPSGIARVTADQLYGNNSATGGFTAYGHVVLDYATATVTADQAVYNAATKILRATGHVTLTQADGDTATASALEYHSDTDRAELFDVQGSTAAINIEGQQIQGRLYYKGESAIVDPDGHTIIRNGWITTCDPAHVAYHVSGKEIEIKPHDHVIAHSSALYLGGVVVAALGILALPLSEAAQTRRQSQYAPRIGYNSVYGVFIRNFINFYRGPNWYGTYHVDFYQKVGIGLGADFYFQRLDGRGGGELSVYNMNNNGSQQALTGTRNTTQATLNMNRLFTPHLSAELAFNYSGQSAVFTALPTTTSTNLAVTHSGDRSTTSYVLTDTVSGPSKSFGGILQHTIAFSPTFSQTLGLNLQDNTNPGAFSRAVGFNWDTHVTARAFDADFLIQTNHGSQTNALTNPINGSISEVTTPGIGIQRVPELTLRSRPFELQTLRLPISITLIDGVYDDGYDNIETSRAEFNGQFGPGIYRIGEDTVFNATAIVRQDAYGTGDLQGALGYNVTMQHFFDHYADNTLLYTSQSVRGYTPMPSLDKQIGSNQIGEILNVYNGSFYRFTASTSYDFTQKLLSPINYQVNINPSPFSFVNVGTSYTPGVGYSPMVLSFAAPVSKEDYLQFSGDYDFGMHALQGQNWYLSHIVEDCYVIRVAYHQPLKEVDMSFALLAFPGQSANFGINNNGPIIAQGFGQ